MNVRHHLKCEVCGSVTLVRTQLGWLEQHPIRIYCGTCGILISGTCFQNPLEGTFKFEFNNAEVVQETRPNFYIEASGELLTEKLQPYFEESDVPYTIPPFFNSLWAMGDESFMQFKSRTIQFLHLCKNDWPKVRRVIELWLSGNSQYLTQEIRKYLPEKQFPANNDLEYIRGVHHLYLIFFNNIFDEKFFKLTTRFIWKELDQLGKNNLLGLQKLVNHFAEEGLLQRYEEKIFSLLNQFVERFQYLIPIFGVQFRQVNSPDLNENKGITTASFEDLKQFYLDCYEVAGDLVRLIIAYNNLKYRNDFEKMVNRRRDIQTLSQFDVKAKGVRTGFLDGTEIFDRLVFPNLDNKIRNAIGHSSYKYDGVAQLITYYPSGNEDPSDKNQMYLVDFGQKCWHLFQTINKLEELIYQTRKIYYVSKGCKPINPRVFGPKIKDKIGRNDPCLCGSGKKYKKCCRAT